MVNDVAIGFILGIVSLLALVLLLVAIIGRKMSEGSCTPIKSFKSSTMANLNHRTIASTPKTSNETYTHTVNSEYGNASSSYEESQYQTNAQANEFIENNFKQEFSMTQHENVGLISKYYSTSTGFYSSSYRK
jgi:hypothetical protein